MHFCNLQVTVVKATLPSSSQTTSKMYDPLPVLGGSYSESAIAARDDAWPWPFLFPYIMKVRPISIIIVIYSLYRKK